MSSISRHIAALLFVAALPAFAQSTQSATSPATTERNLDTFATLRPGSPLGPEWTVVRITSTADRVRLELRGQTGVAATVSFAPADAPPGQIDIPNIARIYVEGRDLQPAAQAALNSAVRAVAADYASRDGSLPIAIVLASTLPTPPVAATHFLSLPSFGPLSVGRLNDEWSVSTLRLEKDRVVITMAGKDGANLNFIAAPGGGGFSKSGGASLHHETSVAPFDVQALAASALHNALRAVNESEGGLGRLLTTTLGGYREPAPLKATSAVVATSILRSLTGRWTVTASSSAAGKTPPQTRNFTSTRTSVGDRNVLQEVVSDGSRTVATNFIGFDEGKGTVWSALIDHTSGSMQSGTASYDEQSRTLRFSPSLNVLDRTPGVATFSIRVDSPSRHVLELFEIDANGTERRVLEARYERIP
jgi:hypothetical protein